MLFCGTSTALLSTEQLVDGGPNLYKFQEMMRLEDMQKAKSDWAAFAWAVTQVPDNNLLALDRKKGCHDEYIAGQCVVSSLDQYRTVIS